MNKKTEIIIKQDFHEYIDNSNIYKILFMANQLREENKGKKIELCAIINAKSGLCSEDCAFCAQSSKYKTGSPVYSLMDKEKILERALEVKKYHVKRFSIVISGRKATKREISKIGNYIEELKKIGLSTCASLGLLEYDEICFLRDRGLDRIHCNLETSERFFSKICSTHKFSDKIKTLEAAKRANLTVCSGGVFGMGESWIDRIDLANFLKRLDVDSVPINFLTPIRGTPLEKTKPLSPMEALKIIAIYRLILSDKDIRVCGGRPLLGEFSSWIFLAGANAVMTGNYLTTTGKHYIDDLRLIELHGLEVDNVVS